MSLPSNSETPSPAPPPGAPSARPPEPVETKRVDGSAPSASAAPALAPRKLSEELGRLIDEFQARPVTLREVIIVLQERAYDLLMLLLALPFLLPIPVPGLSTLLGTVIAVIAVRLTCGQRPWLPARLLDRELPPKFFPTLLAGARRVLKLFEVMMRPRLLWLTASRLPQLHAFIIFLAALVLLLPMPPGTNFPPALCIVIMAGGLLERDGLFILGGYVAAALNVVFFTVFYVYVEKAIHALWQWISG